MAEEVKEVKETKKVDSKKEDKKIAKKEIKEAKKAAKKKEEVKENKKPAAPKPIVTEAKAIARDLRMTPRKARLIIDLVRGKNVNSALAILNNINKMGASDIRKVIKSAAANATNNFGFNQDRLYIAAIYANDGIKMKRFMPRAKGSASGKVKRACSVTVIVKERL